ncbi:RHS repeat-associated core domain-containing protein, partial [Streptomyces griseoloalbus]|uniref:RHS repeat-associated core domain-containing protein n=1 Tax=Streptomyces griseoloalbus TaxID=67303 RepID=UPI00296F32FD
PLAGVALLAHYLGLLSPGPSVPVSGCPAQRGNLTREYDPTIGQFISVDPLLELDKHQTLNGYSYAVQNPLTHSDPTGLGLKCGGANDPACPTRSDGSKGNGRPNEAAKPATVCVAPCGTAPAKSGGVVEYPAPAESGCGFWDVKCGWNDLMKSECGFWDVKCSWNENYQAWKNAFAPDTEDAENCAQFEAVSCGWLVAGFLPVGKLKKLGKLLGEGKDAKQAAEIIEEAIELVGQIPYGEGHLSKSVQLQRLLDKKKTGNYAAALLEDGTTLVAHADKNYHSEEYLIQRSGDRKIVAVYSEREPCNSGHNYASALRKAGVKNVSWSFPWNGIGDAGRKKTTDDLSAAIRELFKG